MTSMTGLGIDSSAFQASPASLTVTLVVVNCFWQGLGREGGALAALDDLLKGHVLTVVVLGTATVLLPKLLPGPVGAVVKGGLQLFLEAQDEAEGDIIEQLVQTAMGELAKTFSGPGSEAEKRHRAARTLHRFERTARSRARRSADEAERAKRYRRHVRRLKRAIAAVERSHPHAEFIEAAAGTISEDW
jgi:hypothetical protein